MALHRYRRFIPSVVSGLGGLAFQVGGFQSRPVSYALFIVAAVLGLWGVWPWVDRWAARRSVAERDAAVLLAAEEARERSRLLHPHVTGSGGVIGGGQAQCVPEWDRAIIRYEGKPVEGLSCHVEHDGRSWVCDKPILFDDRPGYADCVYPVNFADAPIAVGSGDYRATWTAVRDGRRESLSSVSWRVPER